jgi:hypothetical protein
MIAAGSHMPLPLPKPGSASVALSQHNANGKAASGNPETDARATSAYARGDVQRQMTPSSVVRKTRRVKRTAA